MKVDVVVPSFNSRDSLELLLRSLSFQQVASADSFSVVIVDDGSTDETRNLVDEASVPFDLAYIHKPRTAASSRAAARNAGIEASTADLIVMVDADQVLPSRFVAEHIRYHKHREGLVVMGERSFVKTGDLTGASFHAASGIRQLPEVLREDSRHRLFEQFSRNLNNFANCWQLLWTCNASVRREHLVAIGGFDEQFIGWGLEDTELGYRLRRLGLAFAFNPDAVSYDQHGRAPSHEMRAEWRRNLAWFAEKHRDPEVSLQWLLDSPSYGEGETQELPWLDAMVRMEYAARALQGRLPTSGAVECVEVYEHNLGAVRDRLAELAGRANLVILDHVGDARLALEVQCLDTPRELTYFPHPSADLVERIAASCGPVR